MRHIFCVFTFQSSALDDEEKSWELKHIITIKIFYRTVSCYILFFRNLSFSRLKVCIRALHFQIKVCPVCCWCHIDKEKGDVGFHFGSNCKKTLMWRRNWISTYLKSSCGGVFLTFCELSGQKTKKQIILIMNCKGLLDDFST